MLELFYPTGVVLAEHFQTATNLLIGALLICLGLVALGGGISIIQCVNVLIRHRWVVRVKLPPVTGYCEPAVQHGEPVHVRVAAEGSVEWEVLRLAADGFVSVRTGETEVPGKVSKSFRPWSGMDWPTTFTIDTADLQPGLHVHVRGIRRANETVLASLVRVQD